MRPFLPVLALLAACSDSTDADVDIDLGADSDLSGGDSDGAEDTDNTTDDTDGSNSEDSDAAIEDDSSIVDIQSGLIATETHVSIRDVVVTGIGATGIFVSEPVNSTYAGIWVYLGTGWSGVVARGDRVDVHGIIKEFTASGTTGSVTEIATASFTRLGTGAEPTPLSVSSAMLADPTSAEPYEGVLVTIRDVEVVEANLGYGEWSVTGGLRINDQFYAFPYRYAGDTFASITGVLDYNFGNFKLEPRGSADFVGYASTVRTVGSLTAGDLVISELMPDPQDAGCNPESQGEYIEIYNPGSTPIDLFGLGLDDSSAITGTIENHYLLAANSYAFGVAEPSTDFCYAGVAPAFEFGFSLNNDSDRIALLSGGLEIDAVDYGASFPHTPGVSMNLSSGQLSATANDSSANWCSSTLNIGASADRGTPGAANGGC